MMSTGNGQQVVSVPPGFRFHPTEEELLYYYLRKKVSYESIDLDVIREVDLNKLEPWDLKDKCRIGSGPQNEWYLFSHKDKKYPTGTRTNRATTAGFWKATGRDKAIHHSSYSQRIGMRKTLVFYTGRAPHGQKTDWIMHEYRLDDNNAEVQEDGWVVCRVFTKKTHTKIYEPEIHSQEHHHHRHKFTSISNLMDPKQNIQAMDDQHTTFDGSMHLPQLFSNESSSLSVLHPNTFLFPNSLSNTDMECSQNLLRLTSGGSGLIPVPERFTADWSFLDKLLTSHQNMDQQIKLSNNPSTQGLDHVGSSTTSVPRFPLQYLGCETTHNFKFSK